LFGLRQEKYRQGSRVVDPDGAVVDIAAADLILGGQIVVHAGRNVAVVDETRSKNVETRSGERRAAYPLNGGRNPYWRSSLAGRISQESPGLVADSPGVASIVAKTRRRRRANRASGTRLAEWLLLVIHEKRIVCS